MDKRDSEKMAKLAREGKQISKIYFEDFPDYEYEDIYMAVYGAGEKSALGVKRTITNRLNDILSLPKREQKESLYEISELVSHLYVRHKENQRKLDNIRKVIEK